MDEQWKIVSKDMQAHGTPLAAMGYCRIAFDAGVLAGRKGIDPEISLLQIMLEEAEGHSSCDTCAVANKIRAAIKP